jgi:hypothetical protein
MSRSLVAGTVVSDPETQCGSRFLIATDVDDRVEVEFRPNQSDRSWCFTLGLRRGRKSNYDAKPGSRGYCIRLEYRTQPYKRE